MSNLYPIKASFTAGEIAPSLYGRPDLAKYNAGARALENFRIQPYGGIVKRNGTEFIQLLEDSLDGSKSRFIPFQFSLDDSYALLFLDKKVRFYREGEPVLNDDGTVYEMTSPYSGEDLSGLSYTQSADVLFLVHELYPPQELSRISHNDWQWTAFSYENGPFAARTTADLDISIKPSNQTGAITLTASGSFFNSGHVGSLFSFLHAVDALSTKTSGQTSSVTNSLTLTIKTGYLLSTSGGGGDAGEYIYSWIAHTTIVANSPVAVGFVFRYNSVDYTVTKTRTFYNSAGSGATNTSGTFTGVMMTSGVAHGAYVGLSPTLTTTASSLTVTYTSTGNNADWGISLDIYDTWHLVIMGFWYGSVALQRYDEDEAAWVTVGTYTSPQTSTATSVRNFDSSGEVSTPTSFRVIALTQFSTFLPSTSNVDADRGYVELSRPSTVHRGIVKITGVTSDTVASATVITDLASSSETLNWEQGAWSGYEGYPSTVGIFEERMVFGSTTREPQTLWLSKSGDYYNFGTAIPVTDEDAITRTLASRQLNKIEAIVPANQLLVMTSASEWKISGGQTGGLTPTNFTARIQGVRGCSPLEPIIVNSTILFCQAKASKINDLLYSYETDLYQGTDLTILSPHIFETNRVKGWTFQPEPDSTVWLVRDDGVLVSLTYMREHEVSAWARHPMPGAEIQTLTCLNGRREDTVYMLVKRNGLYTVERFNLTHETNVKDCVYLDSSVTVESENEDIQTVSGLAHLEGLEVSALTDGNVSSETYIVSGGQITLRNPAYKVIVGRAYTAYLETLDLGFDNNSGTQLTSKARITELKLRVLDTRGLFISTDEDGLVYEEVKDRRREGQGSPIELFSGDLTVYPPSDYNAGRIRIKAPHPLPARIQAIVPTVDLGRR